MAYTVLADCTVCTTGNLNATYNNGAAGVGATLTNAGTLAAFSADGYSNSVNDSVLVAFQTTQFQNGIYTITTLGNGATPWILTRATYYDTPAEITNTSVTIIDNGTLFQFSGWQQTATVATVGTDSIVFSELQPIGINGLDEILPTSYGGTGLYWLYQYNLLLGGGPGNSVVMVAPSATSGVPLISQGSSSNPTYGTTVVAGGGTGNTTFTAYSVICAGTTATGAFQNVSGVGSSGQVLTSNGAAALPTWQATGSLSWTEVTGTSASMAINSGYIANNAGLVTLTLPSTAALGSIVEVSGKGAGGWRIAQNAGQTIYFGSSTSTTGATGHIDSSATRDSVRLLCVTANNDWNVLGCQGNISVT